MNEQNLKFNVTCVDEMSDLCITYVYDGGGLYLTLQDLLC